MDGFTGIDRLRLAEVPEPELKPGELLLEVHYAGLNPADRYLAERQYPAKPPLPHILGRDGLGTVLRVGGGVSGVNVGDQRAILRGETGVTRPGTFAQRIAVPAQDLVEPVNEWRETEAAGATLVYITAYQAITMWGPLAPGSVVLVTGASGGVGVATVQLAAAMGCTVVGLSRSREKSERLRQLGATFTFDPHDPQWRQAAKQALAPRRVALAVDNVGGKLLPEVIDTLGDQGKVSLVGRLAGPVPNFNTATLFFRRLCLGGVAAGAYTNAEGHAAWRAVCDLLRNSGGRPQVDSVFPFGKLPQAFARLAEGPLGKVLLQVKS